MLGVSSLYCCRTAGHTASWLEHLPQNDVPADGGKERKAQDCFEFGIFFLVSFEEMNNLFLSIFSGVCV